jgi:hypothetical protein
MVYSFKVQGDAAAIRAYPGLLVKRNCPWPDAADKEKHPRPLFS